MQNYPYLINDRKKVYLSSQNEFMKNFFSPFHLTTIKLSLDVILPFRRCLSRLR